MSCQRASTFCQFFAIGPFFIVGRFRLIFLISLSEARFWYFFVVALFSPSGTSRFGVSTYSVLSRRYEASAMLLLGG